MTVILAWYRDGGPFMPLLLLVGLAGLLVLTERIAHLVHRSRVHARPFMERVISLVRADRIDEALALCAAHDSALPDLGLVILRSRDAGEVDLLHVSEVSALSVVPGLTRRVAWLPALAIIAVLVGTLGAIVNLHEGLTQAAREGGAASRVLEAVVFALRPLGGGVLTAIPLLLGHAYLVNASQRLVAQLEEFSARLVNALVDRPDVRLGHR